MIRTVVSDAQWDRIEGLVPGKATDRGGNGSGQPDVRGGGFVGGAHGRAVARPAAGDRPLEHYVPALFPLVESGGMGESFQGLSR